MTDLPASAASTNSLLQQRVLELVLAAKAADPLAAVTLIVDGAAQGWSFRRQLASRIKPGGAVANLNVLTREEFLQFCLTQAGGELVDRDRLISTVATESLLARVDGPLAAAAHHRDSVQLLTSLSEQLAWCELTPADVDRASPEMTDTASAALEFVVRMRQELHGAAAVRNWAATCEQICAAPLDVFERLRTQLGTLLVVSQRPPAGFKAVLEQFLSAGGQVELVELKPAAAPRADWQVLSCPDPATECAVAVREVAAALAATAASDIALVYAAASPYAGLLGAELDRAGLQWYGPSADNLSTLTLSRMALLFAELAAAKAAGEPALTRPRIMQWLTAAPLQLGEERVAAVRLRSLIRDENLYGDAASWLPLLQQLAANGVELEADAESPRERQRQSAGKSAEQLFELLTALTAVIDAMAAAETWEVLGKALFSALHRFYLAGGVATESDRLAASVLETLLLSSLPLIDDELEPSGSPALLLPQLLERQFAARALRHGSPAVGVHVGPLSSVRGLSFKHIVVVGVAEGMLPVAGGANPLLPEGVVLALRRYADDLPTAAEAAASDRAEWDALTQGASDCVFTYPRGGVPRLAEGHPSPWLSGFNSTVVESSDAALRRQEPATEADYQSRGTLATAVVDPALAAQVRASHPLPDKSVNAAGLDLSEFALSSSGIETFLHCPHDFFVSKVLGFDTEQYPDDVDEVSSSDFGTLLHSVFERFILTAMERALVPDLGEPWPAAALELLTSEFDAATADAEQRGLIGWLPSWRRQVATARELLGRFLELDADLRGALLPQSVERAFGVSGAPEVSVSLADGTVVKLRGFIDRLDVSRDGSQVGVLDYKSGKPDNFEKSLKASDPIERSKVQDLVYAIAAETLVPGAESTAVNFLFFPNRGEPKVLTASGDRARADLVKILEQVRQAFETGEFPARPRARDYCRVCNALGRRASLAGAVESGADDE